MALDEADGADGARGNPVPHALFSTDDVAAGERYTFWRDSIACIFEVEAPRDVRSADFHAEIDANMFGPVMLARTRTRPQSWARTPHLMARDGMDHYMIQLFEQGTMQWQAEGDGLKMPAGGLVIFDLAREARTVTNDFANLSLIIPRDMLEDRLTAADDQHMRVLQPSEPMVGLLRDHMLSLKRLASQMTMQQAVAVAPATAGLAAACVNAALGEDPEIRAGVTMAQMGRIRRFVEAHLAEPELSADWIARQAGVSRSKLYTLFEPFGGVASYVRERRLRRALLALSDPAQRHRPIQDIARLSGYGSDTAFSRAFRSRYGAAPADIRQSGAPRAAPARQAQGIDRRYEHWLHHLSV